jgi:hypothetical protein
MNMSEFEGRPQRSMPDLSHSPKRDRQVPEDFSEEELAFARELEALFPIDEEELPPFYVQTLMASEDPRLQVAEPAFEKKVSARVFRSLKLRRRLFRSSQSPVYVLTSVLHQSRPFVAVSMACLLFMFITMVATSPLFATGLNYLRTGSHSGVLQVRQYPVVSSPSSSPVQQADIVEQKQISFEQAQQVLHFQIYWPVYLPPHYNQSDTYLYDANQDWADGPIMVVDFFYAVPGQPPRQLSICEFKPQGDAFQVVRDGAAIKIDQDTSPSAIYVEGQWKPDGTSSPTWVYNGRSELIYEHDGLVFWIVGDKLGGIDETVLSNIASSLRPFNERSMHLNQVTRAIGEPLSSFGDDVVYLNNPDNPRGPSFILVGAPPALSRVQRNLDSIP